MNVRTDFAALSVSSRAWSSDERKRLINAYHRGGVKAAIDEFPDRTPAVVRSAIQRFRDQRPMGRPSKPIDIAAVRARIKSIPPSLFFERLANLIGGPI